jgi:hypothetical protein
MCPNEDKHGIKTLFDAFLGKATASPAVLVFAFEAAYLFLVMPGLAP